MTFSSLISKNNLQEKSTSPDNGKQPFFKPIIQPKLTINQPNDIYEQEADAMADKVMRMPDVSINNTSFFKPAISSIQRKCAHCEEEKSAQRKETNSSEPRADTSTENYINSLSGKGRPLTPDERSFFEPRFGYDFSNVQLHTGAEANQSAQLINALAYTTGNNIIFNNGQYAPDTDSGKKLLSHELTHVIQQNDAQTNSIQRAVFVCDEYRTVAPTTYNPGPGISLSLSGHAVTIRANMEIYGAGATSAIAANFKSTIENYWNHAFDDGYSVSTVANVTVQGSAPDTSKTRIDIINAEGVTNVAPRYWIAGANYMQYYTGSSKIDWTPAHEFGHLLGLPDHYSESIVSSIAGTINPNWRTTTEDAGWEGNLMARVGGGLEKKNIRELIRIGFRARQECVRGHSESPL